jgi:hypothetical protein
MKKTVFGLAVLTALVVAGCSKSDSSNPITDTILGKWTPVSIKVVMNDKVNFTSKTTYADVYPGDYWDFRKDGKVYRYETDPNEGPGYDPHDTLPYKWNSPYWIIGEDSMTTYVTPKDTLKLELYEGTATRDWWTTYTFAK